MNISYLTPEELRAILNEELDKRFGPIPSTPPATSIKNAHADEDELIGTKEACRILGCCSKTMQSYRNRKLFRVVMRGPKKAMYYKSEILAFRAANTRPSRDMKRK